MRTIAILLILCLNLAAALPRLIAYQGLLSDAHGNARPDGQYEVTFALYAAREGGSSAWSETQTLSVKDGLFAALLGNLTPLGLPFDEQYWLAVQVEGHAVGPRAKLAAAAYALRAARADTSEFALSASSATSAVVSVAVRGTG